MSIRDKDVIGFTRALPGSSVRCSIRSHDIHVQSAPIQPRSANAEPSQICAARVVAAKPGRRATYSMLAAGHLPDTVISPRTRWPPDVGHHASQLIKSPTPAASAPLASPRESAICPFRGASVRWTPRELSPHQQHPRDRNRAWLASTCAAPLACRCSTAFSCRSTSRSASFASSPRNTRTARPSNQRISK
jgi:hypothetical protein